MPGSWANDRGGYIELTKPVRTISGSWLEKAGGPVLFDDFFGTVDSNTWTITSFQATGGTDWVANAAAGKPTAGHGGWIRGVTGTGDNDCEAIAGKDATGIQWAPAQVGTGMLVCETSITGPSIAGIGFSFGLTDDATESGDIVTVVAGTATLVPNDAVLWNYDTDATADLLRGYGVKATVATSANETAVNSTVFVADTATCLRIEVDSSGNANWFRGNTSAGRPSYVGHAANATTAATLHVPILTVSCKAGSAAKTLDCDYILVAAPR